MISQSYNNIVTPELSLYAILNKEFHGFEQDYIVMHCLLKIHKPVFSAMSSAIIL